MTVDHLELALIEPLEPPGDALDPSDQGRAIQPDPLAGQHLSLTIERHVPGVFPDRDTGHQRRGRHATDQQSGSGRRLDDRSLTGAAGILRADGGHHAHDRWHDIQGLGDILADPVQRACATGTRAHLRLDHTLDAGQPAR